MWLDSFVIQSLTWASSSSRSIVILGYHLNSFCFDSGLGCGWLWRIVFFAIEQTFRHHHTQTISYEALKDGSGCEDSSNNTAETNQEVWSCFFEERIMRLNRRNWHVPDNCRQHIWNHHLVHGAIWEPNEDWVLWRWNSSLFILLGNLVGSIDVLFFANVEVIVDEELAERNFLCVFATIKFVVDLATVLSIDHFLVFETTERQVVDRVSEVNLITSLHKLHHGLRAVMWAQVEVTWHLMNPYLSLNLAALLIIELSLCCSIDDILRAFSCLLFDCISDTLDDTILVEGVLVKSTFHVHLMDSSDIDNVQSQDGARSLW